MLAFMKEYGIISILSPKIILKWFVLCMSLANLLFHKLSKCSIKEIMNLGYIRMWNFYWLILLGEYLYLFKNCFKFAYLFLSPQKPAPPPPPPDWSKESGKVHFLTNETWDSFMAEHPSVLVMFFAPCMYKQLISYHFNYYLTFFLLIQR